MHILSRGKPDVKPLRLYFRRVVIQLSGQGESRAPFPSFEGCKRAPGEVAQRPPPPKRARADKARADRRPTGGGPSARQQEKGSAPPNGRRAPGLRATAPRHSPPSPPQRTGGHFARRNFRRACATGTTAERERERQRGRHQRPPPSPAPWRSRHQEPPATAPLPGNVGACQPPSAPAERRRSARSGAPSAGLRPERESPPQRMAAAM